MSIAINPITSVIDSMKLVIVEVIYGTSTMRLSWASEQSSTKNCAFI